MVGEPVILSVREQMAVYGCSVAINKAQKAINLELVQNPGHFTLEDAQAVMEKNKWAMETLCPAGGDCYITDESEEMGHTHFQVVCGLHDEDARRRTRLNARNVLEQLETEIKHKSLMGAGIPESVSLTLNGDTLKAALGDDELPRGTYTTPGYEGTVAFYSADDEGVYRMSFADENYSANWDRGWGWNGSAYEDA